MPAAVRGWGGRTAALVVLCAPAVASAQGRSCDLVQAADYRQIVNAQGETVIYFRDPVRLRCTGDVRLSADSAVINRTQASFELVGDVVYRDSTRQLESDWANYLGQPQILFARGDVVVTDLADSSVITGQQLEYQRESASRPASRVMVRGGRPRALLRSADEAGPGSPEGAAADTAPPLDVVADRLDFRGQTVFTAAGDVEIERGDMRGAADSARYDRPAAAVALRGAAWVETDRYRLEGSRIDASMPENELRDVYAEEEAMLRSDELTVEAERLRIGFVAGRLDRLEAWNPPDPGAARDAPPPRRALALAEDFRLRADSIDARADSGLIREVRAVGRAHGERQLDSLAARLPAVIARDWIQGDTIIGYFVQAVPAPAEAAPDSAPVTAGPVLASPDPDQAAPADSLETVLERVVVIGGSGPALSLYRMEPEAEGGRQAVNFMKARRIVLFLADGEVTSVEAEGPIEGMYLDPATGAPTGPGTESPAAESGAPPGTAGGRAGR